MNFPKETKFFEGATFGKWTILNRTEKRRPPTFICRCSCGNVKELYGSNLSSGKSTQCSDCANNSRSEKLIGTKFGHALIVGIEKIGGISKAKIKCDCGRERFMKIQRFTQAGSKSCGLCNLGKTPKQIPKLFEGNKLGYLTIIKKREDKTFDVLCECGTHLNVKNHHLKTQFPSCGCYWKNKRVENAERIVGLKYGRLKVSKFLGMIWEDRGSHSGYRAHYLLKCECGNELIRSIGHMFDIGSCGCLHKDSIARGEDNWKSKNSNQSVLGAIELFNTGLYTRREISEILEISYECCCVILKGKSWKHLQKKVKNV